jgi:RecG-like helicase
MNSIVLVEQRSKLWKKMIPPHVLVMTATLFRTRNEFVW